MEKSNKILIVLLVLILLIGGCKKPCPPIEKTKLKHKVNTYEVQNNERWLNSKNVDTTDCLRLELLFLNNPYGFRKRNNVIVYLDEEIIYKGIFNTHLCCYIPRNKFCKTHIPGMAIYDEKSEYNFLHKKAMYLDKDDLFLYIIFCPENDLIGSCYLFSQKNKIL